MISSPAGRVVLSSLCRWGNRGREGIGCTPRVAQLSRGAGSFQGVAGLQAPLSLWAVRAV